MCQIGVFPSPSALSDLNPHPSRTCSFIVYATPSIVPALHQSTASMKGSASHVVDADLVRNKVESRMWLFSFWHRNVNVKRVWCFLVGWKPAQLWPRPCRCRLMLWSLFVCVSIFRNFSQSHIDLTLYTVNDPWLYSVLWCSGVSAVSSEAPHVLKKVPYPSWLMVRRTTFHGNQSYLFYF